MYQQLGEKRNKTYNINNLINNLYDRTNEPQDDHDQTLSSSYESDYQTTEYEDILNGRRDDVDKLNSIFRRNRYMNIKSLKYFLNYMIFGGNNLYDDYGTFYSKNFRKNMLRARFIFCLSSFFISLFFFVLMFYLMLKNKFYYPSFIEETLSLTLTVPRTNIPIPVQDDNGPRPFPEPNYTNVPPVIPINVAPVPVPKKVIIKIPPSVPRKKQN